MKKIVITLPALAAVLMLSACAVPAEETAPPPVAGAQAQPSEKASGKATSAPAPKHWVTVAKLSGTGNKRGTSFHLNGGDARLTYSVRDTSGFNAAVMSVYVVAKGDSLEKSGGFPEVMADHPGKDSTQLAKDEGDYYLDVQAANAKWSVTVQEKR